MYFGLRISQKQVMGWMWETSKDKEELNLDREVAEEKKAKSWILEIFGKQSLYAPLVDGCGI